MIIKRHLLPICFFLWMILFGSLLIGQNYTLFLRPSFAFLIYLGLTICALFLASYLYQEPPLSTEATFPYLIKGLLFILPIIYMLSYNQETLGTFALKKKSSGLESNYNMTTNSNISLDTDNYNSLDLTQLAQLSLTNNSPIPVETIGQIYLGPEQLPSGFVMLFRFAITCCAADARPIAFLLPNQLENIKDDDWVKVQGNYQIQNIDGHQLRIITPHKIIPIQPPPPSERYLYY